MLTYDRLSLDIQIYVQPLNNGIMASLDKLNFYTCIF